MKTLFRTVVGSHAWNMNNSLSDIDTFEVYIVPTKDILSGKLRQNSHFTSGENKDESRHEIGVVIEQLIKGNFNFIVGVCSPIVEYEYSVVLKDIRNITEKNLSKCIYNSTKGLAIHNYKKYFINNVINNTIDEKELQKKANMIVRSLIFAENILSNNNIRFITVKDQKIEDIEQWLHKLDNAYENSSLQESPDQEPFREYLYNLRLLEHII